MNLSIRTQAPKIHEFLPTTKTPEPTQNVDSGAALIRQLRDQKAESDPQVLPRADSPTGDTYPGQIKPIWHTGTFHIPGTPVVIETLADALAQLNGGKEVELADPGLTDKHDELNNNDNPADDIIFQDIDGEVIVDGASLTDIKQGAVGDCYFVAALASIAHHNPEYIENMITDNGNGTYTVSFGGDLGDVTVDDDFATNSSGNSVYASTGSSSNPELWVAIVEKAYAQANGSYETIEGGRANEAIAEITGQDNFTVDHPSDFDPADLQTALENGQSVTASSLSSNDGKKTRTSDGFVTSHAYVVTDVQQNASGEWEITVYNPWGSDSDTGDGTSDGFTTISVEEFNTNFRSVQLLNEPVG